VSNLSFRKNPRTGQAEVIARALDAERDQLCAKLPTGYGKTYTAACVYSSLQHQGRVDRLLYLVPTVGQLSQFVQDGKSDLEDACVDGAMYICDIGYSGAAQTIKQHRRGSHQVFATTIQALSTRATGATVRNLMETGNWMICVDEYHHYGLDKTWGRAVLDLQRLPSCKFLLAMSATPNRPGDDSAFGSPDVSISYRRAVLEESVKPMQCHAYTYRIDAIENGDVISYTMQDLLDQSESERPDALEKVFSQMRWSPKYISPLVDTPIARMIRDRCSTGQPLQTLIGATCCSHASMVCDQVKTMFPELRIDWVGTGMNGRSDGENKAILRKFCPDKVDGRRRPQDVRLDVLVHVGMAGEGLDTIYVSEVVHLNPANKNNSNDQENGRGARFLPGVMCTINVETGSDYAEKYLGRLIEMSFDSESPTQEEPAEDEPIDRIDEIPELPEEPNIQILDVECININTGEVQRMAQAFSEASGRSLDDPEVEAKALAFYRQMRRQDAEQFNERSTVEQWSKHVENALSTVARRVARRLSPGRSDKAFIGDIRKRINTKKKRTIGAIEKDVATLRRHWNWLRDLDHEVCQQEVPAWLA